MKKLPPPVGASGMDPLPLLLAVIPVTNLAGLVSQAISPGRHRTSIAVVIATDFIVIIAAAGNVYFHGYNWRVPILLVTPIIASVGALVVTSTSLTRR